jgi:SAM-dependent methyltransferase/uncharacterized membrane protein YbhN (UPF0104 family)
VSPRAGGPPRRIAWLLLFASAAAVLLTGAVGTLLVFGRFSGSPASVPAGFWGRLAVAAALTIASLMLRSLRWIFLLRRAQTRIPIRDAYIGYFAGLSLLLTPFLLGEVAVRAAIHRARGQVPVATTVLVNLWERWLDLVALALVSGVLAIALGRWSAGAAAALLAAAATLAGPVRRASLAVAERLARPAGHLFDANRFPEPTRFAEGPTWIAALVTSVGAWLLPGLAFWYVAGAWGRPFDLVRAEFAYAASSGLGGLVLAPGGVLVAGGRLLAELDGAGFPPDAAVLSVFGIRLATVGVATMLGAVFLLVHMRSPAAASAAHFDDIADAYDVQIPESRRQALLARKTEMMREAIRAFGVGRRGFDAGCGQGWYVARMRELGFDVHGLDASAGQAMLAARHAGGEATIVVGSLLEIPEPPASYDFVYTINVLHHLRSVDEQRRAFGELLRILKPGGLLFVHEINTRNILFRFYMGYIFPSLNCIDEGVERWLLPGAMAMYTDAPLADVRYFTFFPDFLPQAIVRLLAPIERLLEASPLRVYSAHYMAVLRKPGPR